MSPRLRVRRFTRDSLVAYGILVGLTGCSHPLTVTNLNQYSVPVKLSSFESAPLGGILPYSGTPDGRYYFNSLIERINQSPLVASVQTEYIMKPNDPQPPDLILSIDPVVQYRSSGWNFLINWPGFIIIAPVWHGYVYHADIDTGLVIHDSSGQVLSDSSVPMAYNIRQADPDRAMWASFPLGWLAFGSISLLSGIYDAFNFDRDIIGDLQGHIDDNYGRFVANQVSPKVQAAADSLREAPAVGAGPADAPAVPTGSSQGP